MKVFHHKLIDIAFYSIKLLIGIIFIISAITKLITLDSFEVYVYSLGIFSLNFSFIVARLLIGFELILGFCLSLSIFTKKTIYVSLITLLGFTFFLFYLLFSGEEEHCHCFGDIIELSHTASIIKNIILCCLLILIIRFPFKNIKYSKIIFPIIVITGLGLPFIYSIPDNLIKREDNISYQQEYLKQFLKENPHLNEGKKVISFVGTGCRFCKLASKKLTVISEKSNNKEDIFYVVWGDEETLNSFYNETHSYHFNHIFLDGSTFLKTTDGKLPLIFLLENGNVYKKYDYRGMQEQEIIDFLSGD